MPDSARFEEALAVAGNLASTWNSGDEVLGQLVRAALPLDAAARQSDSAKDLAEIDPAGGAESPWAAVRRLGGEGVRRLLPDGQAGRSLDSAFAALTRYLSSETWFDRASRRDGRLATLREQPIAYFCAEYGLADWLPIYSGGLGVLAGDVLKEASDIGLPLVGVGLFYGHGFFRQRLDEHFFQVETSPVLDPASVPLSLEKDRTGEPLVITVPVEDRQVAVRIWRLDVGRVPLYLLDTNVPENERPEDRGITDELYGGDEDLRIRQEIVLGIGGVRALAALGIEPAIYSMNEGHAAFLGVELLANALERDDFGVARARTRSRVVYTNHTVVPAGNDVFSRDLVGRYLGAYAESRGIGADRLTRLATTEDGRFSMPVLAFELSGKANGVSKVHGTIVHRDWPHYEIEVVTNGVHVPSWLGPSMRGLLDATVPTWLDDDPDWTPLRTIPLDRLWNVHARQRADLIERINASRHEAPFDPNALTVVWARRFTGYKRPGLLASDLSRLAELAGDGRHPIQIVIAGKSHPRDLEGKRTMQRLLQRLTAAPATAQHAAFLEDYGIGVARSLTAGADVWLNTPRKPLEASGTSGMKSGDNGALQLSVRDGWAAEVDWNGLGWSLEGDDDEQDAETLYRLLADEIVPHYYDRDRSGVPQRWACMMRATMTLTLTRYSTRRMLLEYLDKIYLPLLEERRSLRAVHDSR